MTDYRRRLPHWQPGGAFLFVTWRLAGSIQLPAPTGQPDSPHLSAGQAFVALDRRSDRADSGPLWLRNPRIAEIVAQALRYGEQERKFYSLRAWVVMPNHAHVLFQPRVPLAVITRWLKGSTARKANLLLGRTGKAFWQDESYDHWVRSEAELQKIVRYIERNPVAAGLVEAELAWLWSSAGQAAWSAVE